MRSVKEWVGRTDDSRAPSSVYRRKFRQAGECCQGPCHRSLGPRDSWDLDHIVRIADGGPNAETNLQVLCDWCHGKKTSFENKQGAVVNRKFNKLHGIKPQRESRLAWVNRRRKEIQAEQAAAKTGE